MTDSGHKTLTSHLLFPSDWCQATCGSGPPWRGAARTRWRWRTTAATPSHHSAAASHTSSPSRSYISTYYVNVSQILIYVDVLKSCPGLGCAAAGPDQRAAVWLPVAGRCLHHGHPRIQGRGPAHQCRGGTIFIYTWICNKNNNELHLSCRISMSHETPPPPCQPHPSIRRNIWSREVWITLCTGPGTATLWTGKHSVLIWFLWPSISLCLDFDTEQYSRCQTNGLIH